VKESGADVTSSPLLRESATERKNEEQPVNDMLCIGHNLELSDVERERERERRV
jgi:hypothetical protein